MQAVILAGGLGSRLQPFTQLIPKPLLPIGEKSVLEIQILRLKQYGFDQIYLATNYKSEYIENFFSGGQRLGVKLEISREEKPLGTCGPIKLLQDKLKDPFLVMNGDILTLLDFGKLYKFATDLDANLTVVTKEILTPFQFGNVKSNGNYITGIEEKPNIKTEIIAGIYVFNPRLLNAIPPDKYYGMDNLIKDMLTKHKPIVKYRMHEYWLDIGGIEDFKDAQDVYDKYFKDEGDTL